MSEVWQQAAAGKDSACHRLLVMEQGVHLLIRRQKVQSFAATAWTMISTVARFDGHGRVT